MPTDGVGVQNPENFSDLLDGRPLRIPVIAVRGRQVVGAQHLVVRAGLLTFENVVIEDVAQGRVLGKHHRDGHLQEPQSRGCNDLALSTNRGYCFKKILTYFHPLGLACIGRRPGDPRCLSRLLMGLM